MKVIKKILKIVLAFIYYARFELFQSKKIIYSDAVFFLPYYHTGGAERVHLNILQALKKHKCCVVFTHLSATKNFYEPFKRHANIIEINAIRNKKSSFINNLLRKSIISAINKSRTVKSVFGCNTNYYYYEILPYLDNSKKKIDLIHALDPKDDVRLMLSESATFLEFRVVINKKAKQDIIDIYKDELKDLQLVERIRVIENGVNVSKDDFESYKSKDFEQINIGFLGRWSAEKRPQIFLEVAKNIKKHFPNVSFLMAGTGMKSNLSQINKAGVEFLGEITDEEDLENLYKKLNFVLITSIYEGFPMVIMESMVHGALPICTNVGGIHEHIKDMENGILINDASEEELIEVFTARISFLINNIDVTKKLSKNAFNYSIENFSIEKFNLSYQNLFSL